MPTYLTCAGVSVTDGGVCARVTDAPSAVAHAPILNMMRAAFMEFLFGMGSRRRGKGRVERTSCPMADDRAASRALSPLAIASPASPSLPQMNRRTILLGCLSIAACAHQPSTAAPRPQPAFDLVLENGQVIDGTGAASFPGDVAITGDRRSEERRVGKECRSRCS